MTGLGTRVVGSMMEELRKIASISSPSIKAPPSPSGDGSSLQPKPASPVSTSKITGKALRATNLQKTNYTSVSTKVPNPDFTEAWSKAIPTPAVRS